MPSSHPGKGQKYKGSVSLSSLGRRIVLIRGALPREVAIGGEEGESGGVWIKESGVETWLI